MSREEARSLWGPAAHGQAPAGAARIMNAELRPNSQPQIDGIMSSAGANERVERIGHGRCLASSAIDCGVPPVAGEAILSLMHEHPKD